MSKRLQHALVAAALTGAGLVTAAAPADAGVIPIGVDACVAESFGGDSDCIVIVTGGFYKITATNLDSEGRTYTRVGCTPSGAGGDVNAWGIGQPVNDRIYLPSGRCDMRVWADVHGVGSIVKET
jgi:hypothetical protein